MSATYTVPPHQQQVAVTYDTFRHHGAARDNYDCGRLLGRTVQAAVDALTPTGELAASPTLATVIENRAIQAAADELDPVAWAEQVSDLRRTHAHLISG